MADMPALALLPEEICPRYLSLPQHQLMTTFLLPPNQHEQITEDYYIGAWPSELKLVPTVSWQQTGAG